MAAAKKKKTASGARSKRTDSRTPGMDGGRVPSYRLAELHLDANNARLGSHGGQRVSESKVLDTIVEVFGVDDILSSIATNGFFDAEPLVGVREAGKGGIRIVEGNRRLAACLILAGDDRARKHPKRTQEFRALQQKHGQDAVTEVPVLLHEDDRDLLAYLGVRHIAAAQPWDSFAKAAWVAKVVESNRLELADVAEMIGDQHRTVARTLEGYYFVKQLIDAGEFDPRQSMRPGRGSNPEYPFSWVYTALGHKPVREWLGLKEVAQRVERKPLGNKEKISEAGALMTMLFGDKLNERVPSVMDSREISRLAKALAHGESRRMLKRGKTVREVTDLQRPAKDRITDALYDARESLSGILEPLSAGAIGPDEAAELKKPSRDVRSLAVDVHRKLQAIVSGEGDDE